MNDSIKHINEADFNLGLVPAAATMSMFSSEIGKFYSESSTITQTNRKFVLLPSEIKSAINKVESFKDLPDNWNTYGAKAPAGIAIRNSIDFLCRLAKKQRNPSFIIPTPDEGIAIELQEENVRLEFLFLSDNTSEVSGYIDNELKFEHPLTETTEHCSLKWLFCPDGNCTDWE